MLGEKGGDEMNEWEVVGVIVVLLGLIASISGPMIKLNGTLTPVSYTHLDVYKRQVPDAGEYLRGKAGAGGGL